jgi:uncharacterized protein YecT (DUF1311 family)
MGVSMHRYLSLIIVSLIFVSQPAIATNACGSASNTQLDMNRCAYQTYQEADAELNRVYKTIRKAYANDPKFLEALRDSQRAWIKLRDADLKLYYPHKGERAYYGSYQPVCDNRKLTEITQERVAFLKQWLIGKEEGDVCAGSINLKYNLAELLAVKPKAVEMPVEPLTGKLTTITKGDIERLIAGIVMDKYSGNQATSHRDLIANYFWGLYLARSTAIPEQHRYNPTRTKTILSEYEPQEIKFADHLTKISRDGKQLIAFYEDYKPFIYQWLTKDKFNQYGFDFIVKMLIVAHGEITQKKDWQLKLDKINQLLAVPRVPKYTYIGGNPHECNIWETFDSEFCMSLEYWFYSFWLRRYNENNMEQVLFILKEVGLHYELFEDKQ